MSMSSADDTDNHLIDNSNYIIIEYSISNKIFKNIKHNEENDSRRSYNQKSWAFINKMILWTMSLEKMNQAMNIRSSIILPK